VKPSRGVILCDLEVRKNFKPKVWQYASATHEVHFVGDVWWVLCRVLRVKHTAKNTFCAHSRVLAHGKQVGWETTA
jgi:hypothetical protein